MEPINKEDPNNENDHKSGYNPKIEGYPNRKTPSNWRESRNKDISKTKDDKKWKGELKEE